MIINIFILCHNERILLPFTINYYKQILPNSIITIYDNESSDDSLEIAKSLNCNVISWSSNNENNVSMKSNISNHCWKTVKDGWVIVIDMDEWLCISEEMLKKEQENGTTILSTQGIEMIGESESETLEDINLSKIKIGTLFDTESKCVCFYRPKIKEINYTLGCHFCNPIGCIKFSSTTYIIKHFSCLGLPFYKNKISVRFKRSERLILEEKMSCQYNVSKEEAIRTYISKYVSSFPIENLKISSHYFL
jgi:hypothetical protein